MEPNQQILSDLIVHLKYAHFLPDEKRKETWGEICTRYEKLMIGEYPRLAREIMYNATYIRNRKVLPSMRALQLSGDAIRRNHCHLYNCAYLPLNSVEAFRETMFLLLGGTGVGYSVQLEHVRQLPVVRKATQKKVHVVSDTLEGWSDAVDVLLRAYLGQSDYLPEFDYSQVTSKTLSQIIAGGMPPGPACLKACLSSIRSLIEPKEEGARLSPIDCHDIQCYIGDAIFSGGITRAAMIALFSPSDHDMLTCKSGKWWQTNPQRARANNSAVLMRDTTDEIDFFRIWKVIEASRSGEPGFYFSTDPNWGTNSCCEIAFRPFQLCNLCEINVCDIENQQQLNDRAAAAAFFGTLQAGFTRFSYLRPQWKETADLDALLGVSMTGIASGNVLRYDLRMAAGIVKEVNRRTAKKIGINPAARTTTIKPSGTASLVLGTSAGIHAWHSEFFLRRIRISKQDPLYDHLCEHCPNLVETDFLNPRIGIISIPQAAPAKSILRSESPIDLLTRVKTLHHEWVLPGFRHGCNPHNVSATIVVREEEWERVGRWMWENRMSYNGLSVLPYDAGTYIQAPLEEIDEQEFKRASRMIEKLNLENTLVSQMARSN